MHNMLPTEEDLSGDSNPADITPFQKMLSATTGSLLTGLTSTPHVHLHVHQDGKTNWMQ